MVALHACDIATDYAIALRPAPARRIIMCSPCCHKQIRPQMPTPAALRPMLQHGIHLGQEAEMVTDSLRALLLEACMGYDTQVIEFIALEHTSKNKMVLAVKRPQDPTPARRAGCWRSSTRSSASTACAVRRWRRCCAWKAGSSPSERPAGPGSDAPGLEVGLAAARRGGAQQGAGRCLGIPGGGQQIHRPQYAPRAHAVSNPER